MSTGLKANVDGSAAIQVGGVDAITLTSAGAASFVTSPMTIQGGSASAPSLTFSGDTNTGIFSPAADTIAIGTGGTEAIRVDSSRNVGLGVTPSAWASSTKVFQTVGGSVIGLSTSWFGLGANYYYDGTNNRYVTSNPASLFVQDAGIFKWFNAASGTAGNTVSFTQAMTLDNVALGSAYSSLSLNNSTGGGVVFQQSGTAKMSIFNAGNDGYIDRNNSAGNLYFRNTALGRTDATITSGGDFVVGDTSAGGRVGAVSSANSRVLYAFSTASSGFTDAVLVSEFRNYAPNNTTARLLYTGDNASERCSIRSNGGIANFSGNNVNLSDRREKTNFAPAGDYLAKICAIPVQTFNYIDQNMEDDPGLTLGVVAQDVQEVAPEMVMESNWGTEEEPKMRLSIYQTDLQYALMKCVQELKAELDATKAEVALLKGAA